MRGNPAFSLAIGRHLEFLALGADLEPAFQLRREHLGILDLQHNAGSMWHFLCGAWLTCARAQRAGHAHLEEPLPRLGDGARDPGR